MAPMAVTNIQTALQQSGWVLTEGFLQYITNPSGDYRIDLSGDYGYVWELDRFSDSDVDGVALGRWESTGMSGDTVEELVEALGAYNIGI